MKIIRTQLNFEREPMAAPWGFKGGYLTEQWQAVARMDDAGGAIGTGLCSQSVLWCDPNVFVSTSEAGGNALMFTLTEYALGKCIGLDWNDPFELMDQLIPEVYAHGKNITGRHDLRIAFALNALVAVDNAAWCLYAQQNPTASFDELLPEFVRATLHCRHHEVVSIPTLGYGVPIDDVMKLAAQGFFLFKIKIGSDPYKDGNLDKMVEWDSQRLLSLHQALSTREFAGSPTGHAIYYLDANGRYDSRDRLLQLLGAAERMGALDRIIVVEEPFPEEYRVPVHDLPVRIVADESASTVEETAERMDLGYGAVALKPIAKTMSVSLRQAQLCHERSVPAFCADLTVNPILVEWNKLVASRLPTLPGLTLGLVETNGAQNYRYWERMMSYLPDPNLPWIRPQDGRYLMPDDYFDSPPAAFQPSPHYASLVGCNV